MKQLQSARLALRRLQKAVAALAMIGETSKLPAARGRALALSPKRRAQLKLHGTYIGHLRHLKPRQQAQVKAVKAKKGYEAAIVLATRLAGR